MPDLMVKRRDTWPALKATLEETNAAGTKVPINLSPALKVGLIMKGKTVLVEGSCTGPAGGPLDSTGKVEYVWAKNEAGAAGDTAVADTYELEFEIEWSSAPLKIETVPNESYKEVVIVADLGVA